VGRFLEELARRGVSAADAGELEARAVATLRETYSAGARPIMSRSETSEITDPITSHM
jgi:hypothetical protein